MREGSPLQFRHEFMKSQVREKIALAGIGIALILGCWGLLSLWPPFFPTLVFFVAAIPAAFGLLSFRRWEQAVAIIITISYVSIALINFPPFGSRWAWLNRLLD